MLFHNYLETLLGSKTKIKILRAVTKFPGKDFTTREISKLIGVSHTGVLKALKDLESMNILDIRTHGKAYLIKLNDESFLVQLLHHIFKVEKDTTSHLVEDIKKSFNGLDIVSIALFGSIVQSREEPWSDIDLLILTKDKSGAERRTAKLQREFARKFGNSISAHILDPVEFRKRSPFVGDVLKNHILVCGKVLEDI